MNDKAIDLKLVIGGLRLGLYSDVEAEIDYDEDNQYFRVIKVKVKKEKQHINEDELLKALEAGQI